MADRTAGTGAGKPSDVPPPRDRPGLFEGYGVEIELMIVDRQTLDVRPVCDRLLNAVAGEPVSEFERGSIAWSNELTLHVLELKTNGPAPALQGLSAAFHSEALVADAALAEMGAALLPGAVHPWMDPATETQLWPHEYTEVYRTFDRIFGCSGHGWANLQSVHLNLPFSDDEEFERLHAAIRLVLPLIPGLSAASPFLDGRPAAGLDGRMLAYRQNARRVPSVAGRVVPEVARSREEYERTILAPIYRDLEPHDPEGVLRHEWVNARGAIARFDRGAIEIRVVDAQECPAADLALMATISHLVRVLAVGALADRDLRADPGTEVLATILDEAAVHADRTIVHDAPFLGVLGFGPDATAIGELWSRLLDRYPLDDPSGEWTPALQTMLEEGPLARRMLAVAGEAPTADELRALAERLRAALIANRPLSR